MATLLECIKITSQLTVSITPISQIRSFLVVYKMLLSNVSFHGRKPFKFATDTIKFDCFK